MIFQHTITRTASLALVATLALAACERRPPAPEPVPSESATPEAPATQSIFSPEAGITPAPETLEPLTMVIGFDEGGDALNEAALAEIATILASPQMQAGGPIVLRGHSDAGGDDDANLRVSQARADAVRARLVERGVAEERITVIAFGEQNPVQPNALPDGQPNEEGRAANRRVEIEIVPSEAEDVDEDAENTDGAADTQAE